MEFLKSELHCHNIFSNFHLGQLDTPYDCNIGIEEQLEKSHQMGLDSIFVTNHNTLDGYNQLIDYKKNHEKYQNIEIFPAEEITSKEGFHIIAYGISSFIKPGLTFQEIIDEIKKQDAISSAPHPFGIVNGMREKAKHCDLIEVFNSNNVDLLSNTKATFFAKQNEMTGIAGSDSHVVSTIGRCTNVIEAEKNLDSVICSMKHQKIKILHTGYSTPNETLDHLKFKIDNSKQYVQDYLSKFYPNSKCFFNILLQLYEKNPDSYLWLLFYKLAVFAMKRISKKLNFQDQDPSLIEDRNIVELFKMTI